MKLPQGMFGTLIGLFCYHRKQRDLDRGKRLQYWKEQVRPFAALGALFLTAAAERLPPKPQKHA